MRNLSKLIAARQHKLQASTRNVIESLENRQLLSVTLLAPFTSLSVAQDASPTVISLDAHIDDPAVTGTTIVITTPNGSIPIELTDSATPLTAQHFLTNLNNGVYNNTLFYRSVQNFVIQG